MASSQDEQELAEGDAVSDTTHLLILIVFVGEARPPRALPDRAERDLEGIGARVVYGTDSAERCSAWEVRFRRSINFKRAQKR